VACNGALNFVVSISFFVAIGRAFWYKTQLFFWQDSDEWRVNGTAKRSVTDHSGNVTRQGNG